MDEWRNLYASCASQRLFLPEILTNVDSLLYVDTDVLFLSDVKFIWDKIGQFNQTHYAGMVAEQEKKTKMGWYEKNATYPYYGKFGLNSGVILMNMTRMREFDFVNKIVTIFNKYKNQIKWGDQCLLNILFQLNPGKLYFIVIIDYDIILFSPRQIIPIRLFNEF